MKFYNLKTRSHVEIPDAEVMKTKMVRKTKSGEQTRYAFYALHNGTKLYRFVKEADYNSSAAKEA